MLGVALKVNRYTFRGSNYDIFNFSLSLISIGSTLKGKNLLP